MWEGRPICLFDKASRGGSRPDASCLNCLIHDDEGDDSVAVKCLALKELAIVEVELLANELLIANQLQTNC